MREIGCAAGGPKWLTVELWSRCRVSRKAIICFAFGLSSGGWGPLGLLVAVGFAIAAAIELRQRRKWLTGWKFIVSGLVLGSIFSIPAIVWWSYAIPLHRAAVFLGVQSPLTQRDESSRPCQTQTQPSMYCLNHYSRTQQRTAWGAPQGGKYSFAAGNIEEALSELSPWTEHSNIDISVAALTWRGAAEPFAR